MECSVCFDAFPLNEESEEEEEFAVEKPNLTPIALCCGHVFHRSCIDRFLRTIPRERRCPMCRANFRWNQTTKLDLVGQMKKLTDAEKGKVSKELDILEKKLEKVQIKRAKAQTEKTDLESKLRDKEQELERGTLDTDTTESELESEYDDDYYDYHRETKRRCRREE